MIASATIKPLPSFEAPATGKIVERPAGQEPTPGRPVDEEAAKRRR